MGTVKEKNGGGEGSRVEKEGEETGSRQGGRREELLILLQNGTPRQGNVAKTSKGFAELCRPGGFLTCWQL